eukprot:9139963-Alexandrium_andersonii.AAC.1
MSASLVGSEMCIRDRSRAVSKLRNATLAMRYSMTRTPSTDRTEQRTETCLLYTSDAADDM